MAELSVTDRSKMTAEQKEIQDKYEAELAEELKDQADVRELVTKDYPTVGRLLTDEEARDPRAVYDVTVVSS